MAEEACDQELQFKEPVQIPTLVLATWECVHASERLSHVLKMPKCSALNTH